MVTAFSRNGEPEDNYGLYTKLVDLRRPLHRIADPPMDLASAWSPDGRQLAFLRCCLSAPKYRYETVPALGGAVRRVVQGSITPNVIGIPPP